MLKNRLLPGLLIMVGIFAACEKPEVYNPDKYYEIDEARILKWADSTGVELTRHESGIYYHIDSPGTGTETIQQTDTLQVTYEGKLLQDSVFRQTGEGLVYKFVLENSIPGWKIGLPLITVGGQIRLLIPSPLAYREYATSGVPPNSPLDFTVNIKKVSKKIEK